MSVKRFPDISVIIIVTAVSLLAPASIRAQTYDDIPAIAAADSLFDSGIVAFRAARYEQALSLFRSVADRFPRNRRSTAAMLMVGKAQYRLGEFDAAAQRLDALVGAYPSSTYADDARRTALLARDALSRRNQEPIKLGVILSTDPNEALQTQALFNGLLLAVETYNARHGLRPSVQLVFRDIGPSPEGAATAVRSLARRGVGTIVGAVFSDQARAAGRAAESEGVVFIAPLATDERVSAGRRYTFQANPSISMRGRLMARFAVNGLLLRSLGVLSERDPQRISARMAEAFAREAETLGADIPFEVELPSNQAWYRLDEFLSADTLSLVRALYVPLSGDRADRIAGTVLSGMDRFGTSVRLLGNGEWHDLPVRAHAGHYNTTYTNDYFVDRQRPEVNAFLARYQDAFGATPNRLGFVGYDIGTYVAALIDPSASTVRSALLSAPPYAGLGMRIDFRGSQENQSVFYHRYRDGRLELLR